MANTTITALTELTSWDASAASANFFVVDNGVDTKKLRATTFYPTLNNVGSSGVNVVKEINTANITSRKVSSANNYLGIAINANDEVEFTISEANIDSLIAAKNYLTTVNLGTNVTGVLSVANGGTAKSTFTSKSLVATQLTGSSALRELDMTTNGGIVIGGASGPQVSTLTAGTNISITNSDGGIQINSTLPSTVVEENDNVTLGNVTLGALTVGSLSAASAGAVTQITSLATTVTLNAVAGTITLFEAAIVADTNTQFTVVNDKVSSTSVIFLSKEFESNVAANNGVHVSIASVSTGSFAINVTHTGNQNAASIVRKIHFFVFG